MAECPCPPRLAIPRASLCRAALPWVGPCMFQCRDTAYRVVAVGVPLWTIVFRSISRGFPHPNLPPATRPLLWPSPLVPNAMAFVTHVNMELYVSHLSCGTSWMCSDTW